MALPTIGKLCAPSGPSFQMGNEKAMKLILGAAQFGLPYGVTNYTGKMPDDRELKSTLDYAFDNGIDTIDTAEGYGVANERLAFYLRNNDRNFRIINKIFRQPILTEEAAHELRKNLLNAREAFNISSFDCIMLHYAPSVCQSPTVDQSFFSSLVENGICKHIGLSINHEDDYFSLNKRIQIDLLQAPFNLLNQHILNPAFVQSLKAAACKIHVRSLFLQGLLLAGSRKIPAYLKNLTRYVESLENLASDMGESLMTLCFVFGLSHPFVEGFVIGVQSQRELAEVLEGYHRACEVLCRGSLFNFHEFNCKDASLVDPTQWDRLKKA